MEMKKRYSIGIDLGTTNTVMSYVDSMAEEPISVPFKITQIVAPGEMMELNSLPSAIYLPGTGEVSTEALSLPWCPNGNDMAIGAYAREMASTSPEKVVTSSKSWLCNDKIDRHSQCLPFVNDIEGIRQISPVEAAALILGHLRDNWNHVMAQDDESLRIENQDVVITVPASFNADARELTVEAATSVGLVFTLLEEPQAAFYAWLAGQGDGWRKQVAEGDVVLVCDIGGGTSDFSLIAVVSNEGDMMLQRLAVGEHTLLGGDNMDLTLAMKMVGKLKAEKNVQLNMRQFVSLTHACRKAKEVLSSGNTKDQTLTILGTGSSLVSGTIKTKISYAELKDALLDGFFPLCGIEEKPIVRQRIGMRNMSLDYATDPAFTHHLAAFLDRHSFKDGDGNPILPGYVLFNGGVTTSELFRDKIIDCLNNWRGDGADPVAILEQKTGDLSVAIGAAWYGHTKRTGGIRIKAGSSRSYYLGIESPMPAIPGMEPPLDGLCVVNFGMEEGSSVNMDVKGLGLLVGEQTSFRFFSSTMRQEDAIGDRIDANSTSELVELPPLQVSLEAKETDSEGHGRVHLIPVRLRSELTEVGTLQLWCDEVNGDTSWKLEFSVRGDE